MRSHDGALDVGHLFAHFLISFLVPYPMRVANSAIKPLLEQAGAILTVSRSKKTDEKQKDLNTKAAFRLLEAFVKTCVEAPRAPRKPKAKSKAKAKK